MQSLQPCSRWVTESIMLHVFYSILYTTCSSEIMLKKLRLSCNGSGYTWATILQGNFFPLEFTFSSFHRNGILMFASSGDDMVSLATLNVLNEPD